MNDSNYSVTNNSNYHCLTRTQKNFLKKGKKINLQEKRAFSYEDYDMKPGTFRQYIYRLKPYIEIQKKSIPTYYKIKGISLPLDSHLVTPKPMGDAQQLITILESLKNQPAKIHDIKIQFASDIHKGLVEKGSTINPSNHSIKITNIPTTDNNIVLIAMVYPKTTQLNVGCTYKPIVYDVDSLLYLMEILGQASMSIFGISGIHPPNVKDWMVTQYHFNKDSVALDGKSFHITLGELSSGLIRYYTKILQNGSTIARVEQIRSPNISILDMMKEVVGDSKILQEDENEVFSS